MVTYQIAHCHYNGHLINHPSERYHWISNSALFDLLKQLFCDVCFYYFHKQFHCTTVPANITKQTGIAFLALYIISRSNNHSVNWKRFRTLSPNMKAIVQLNYQFFPWKSTKAAILYLHPTTSICHVLILSKVLTHIWKQQVKLLIFSEYKTSAAKTGSSLGWQ
jgi:hypothetical protein